MSLQKWLEIHECRLAAWFAPDGGKFEWLDADAAWQEVIAIVDVPKEITDIYFAAIRDEDNETIIKYRNQIINLKN